MSGSCGHAHGKDEVQGFVNGGDDGLAIHETETHESNPSIQILPTSSKISALCNDEDLSDLPERFRRGSKQGIRHQEKGGARSSTKRSDLKIVLNPHVREYVQEQRKVKAAGTKDRWLDKTEFPKSSEIKLAAGVTVDIAPNKISERFKSVSSYLRTHYSLLREDAVGPLRDAVDTFQRKPTMNDNTDLSIYEKVHICGFTFTNMGIAARLKFSTKRAGRRIMWSASRRLVSGSLVALTQAGDNFACECLIAVVAARPMELLERSPSEVDIYFCDAKDTRFDPQTEYVMIEAKQGYFEAYRHTLRALQKLSQESFPLSTHIVGSNVDIGSPDYLHKSPTRCIEAAFEDKGNCSDILLSVDVINDWPSTPQGTTLDQSQWTALEHMLTKKLAIIQGPPGTGKTHVSRIALEIMMQNRSQNDPPIIVAAQTNHALDQLLTHVSKFDPEYVRLGGRSTNADVKKHALFEVRQRERIPQVQGSLYGAARRRLERAHAQVGEMLSIFNDTSVPMSCDKLFQLKIISAEQRQSLVDAAENWVSSDGRVRNPMQHWLYDALIPFKVTYNEDGFGFEDAEEDLEVEQLREIEAEHGVADEEDIELLKGPWKAISDSWTVVTPLASELNEAKKLLDTKQDLWDIPEYLRGPVYFIMKQKVKAAALIDFQTYADQYSQIVEELKIGRWERDAVFLERANIIGMTTTGLSKYRPLIASLKPKIILIEEAAEVIEGPITVACMESVEHLILVGDHQQLQGHCAVQELEGDPFYLNVSMFERLVNLKVPFKTLSCQRRMNPEIRELISSLYHHLEDHGSISTRAQPVPWGTGSLKSFFFYHDWSELKDHTLSTYNNEEARMVARFYRHLIRHEVPASAITVLTFYNGQRKRILKELKNDPETNGTYNIVKTVDSYQGEENDIVILSLVRSNTQGQIGFLDNINRVCVSLSRARFGFYLFGNGQLLSDECELWSDVEMKMSESQPTRCGPEIPLTCIRHNRTITVEWPEDFDQYDGGCDLLCDSKLACGHTCAKRCHPQSHDQSACMESCQKTLLCGHSCEKRCHEPCQCNCEGYLLNQKQNTRVRDSTDRLFPEPTASQNWTEFANGGVREDDKVYAELSTPVRHPKEIDLLDLSPLETEKGVVKQSTVEQLAGERIRFTENYLPAASVIPNLIDLDHEADQSSTESKRGQVCNLMD